MRTKLGFRCVCHKKHGWKKITTNSLCSCGRNLYLQLPVREEEMERHDDG